MVTEQVQGAVGVPVIDPVELLMDSPAGRPVALQVRVAPDWVSVAELVTAVMAEPEEVAQTVLEAIVADSFWAHGSHEQDGRLWDGRFGPMIDWEDGIVRARADALVDRTPPDPYLWGGQARSR